MKRRLLKTGVITATILLSMSLINCSTTDNSTPMMEGGIESINNLPYDEKYKDHGENPFIKTTDLAISTFSVDADGASYANMRRYINLGQLPPKSSIRIEEYLNYFTFDYPEPIDGENVSIDTEVAECPWNKEHLLMRVGLKGKTIAPEELPATNYVFLIDISGSMNSPDKLGILQSGFTTLVDQLGDQDRVAIVTYAGRSGVILTSTPCDRKDEIKAAINKLSASGSTAGAEGITTAYKIALENYIPNGNNRIIIGSDGDFNVGPSTTEELVKLIEEKRDQGVYLTVLGVGGGNLNDHMMEQIANKGNGTYEYIDNVEQMNKVFINERSKFYTIAKDCKIQITFDTEVVDSYRLIGYENRMMQEEDFTDDKKDAGEIGVGQTITAIYEIVPNKKDKTDYAKIDIRYKKPNEDDSRLISKSINSKANIISEASDNMRFASAVAAFGMLMKQSEYKGTIDKDMILSLANSALLYDPNEYRKEFVELVKKSQ